MTSRTSNSEGGNMKKPKKLFSCREKKLDVVLLDKKMVAFVYEGYGPWKAADCIPGPSALFMFA